MIKLKTFQKATFRPAKGHILHDKRRPFGKRKATFWKVHTNLEQNQS